MAVKVIPDGESRMIKLRTGNVVSTIPAKRIGFKGGAKHLRKYMIDGWYLIKIEHVYKQDTDYWKANTLNLTLGSVDDAIPAGLLLLKPTTSQGIIGKILNLQEGKYYVMYLKVRDLSLSGSLPKFTIIEMHEI